MDQITGRAGRGRGADCVVVGGGVAGLAAAISLAAQGFTVQVVEASSRAGGRVRGGMFQGEPADVGFQTLLRSYPAVGDFLDEIGIAGQDLHTFERRVVVHDGVRWRRLKLLGPGGIATSGIVDRNDLVRLGRLAGRAAIGGARELEGGHGQSALEMFAEAGISAATVDLLLRPLLGSMLLDRSLEADAGYVRFLLGMMARGPAVLPVDGMGMIVDRARATLAAVGGMIWTETEVAAIDVDQTGRATGVTLTDGRALVAATVILATGAEQARRLLEPVDARAAAGLPTDRAGCVSAIFALETPLYREATLLLDAAGAEGTDRLDLICQTTNVTRPGSPGPHILVAQSATLGWGDVDPDRYAHAALRRLQKLVPSHDWNANARLVAATNHPAALYRPTVGVRERLPGPRSSVRNLVLAGDATTHPSLEGAVSSGYRAAGIVGELLA